METISEEDTGESEPECKNQHPLLKRHESRETRQQMQDIQAILQKKRQDTSSHPPPTSQMNGARRLLRTITWYSRSKIAPLFHEPGVTDGYRKPGRPWTYYARSLFQLHNETLNVWTHLLAGLYCFYRLYTSCNDLDCDHIMTWPIMAFALSVALCGFCSAFAHLMHSMSEQAHYVCFQIDYLGITLQVQGAGLLGYYLAGSLPFYQKVGSWYLLLNALNAVFILIAFTISESSSKAPGSLVKMVAGLLWKVIPCLAAMGLTGLPVLSRAFECYQHPPCDDILKYHLLVLGFFTLAGFLYVSHFPECLMPGSFNVIHSHALFHIAGACMWKIQLDVAIAEYKNRADLLRDIVKPSFLSVFGLEILVIVLGVLFICCAKVHRDKKQADILQTVNVP